ncbi:MAG: hypothetical protein JEZ12_01965 [Desulfobacterium sp.]|nr:hypothetical protein [Desulfobacterium sp.]
MKVAVLEALCDEMGMKPGRNGVNLRNLEVLCANLRDGRVRSMSRRKKYWSGIPSEYNPVGVSYKMVPCVDQMEAHGYLEQRKGFQDPRTGKGFNTRLMATPKLMEAMEGVTVCKHPDAPLLILKDAEKRMVSYQETGNTRAMKAQLRRYNKLLADTVVELGGAVLGPGDKFVYRVFNQGKWSLGGRFYGAAWHTCEKELRDTILINGEPTVEPDYSSLHPCIMYALARLKMPGGDMYDLPGIEDRKYGKIALLIMVNAENRKAATGAFNEKFKADSDRPKAAEVFAKILDKHPPEIQNMFFSGIGLKLQGLDSRLADTIIDKLTREDIPSLSVHDSFRVQEKHGGRLIELMNLTFRDQWGDQVTPPKVH